MLRGKVVLLSFAGVLAILAVAGLALHLFAVVMTPGPPEVEVLKSVLSPDGHWEARLEQVVYQIAPIGGANPALEVHVIRAGDPARYKDDDPTLAAAHGDWYGEPASSLFSLQWTAKDHLVVQCGHWEDAKRQVDGVTIVYQKMKTTK